MRTGGHFFLGQISETIKHFEEGIGFGEFTVKMAGATGSPWIQYDPRGDFNHFWVGSGNGSYATNQYYAMEWNGETGAWTAHVLYREFFGFFGGTSGYLTVSRAPGTNTVYIAAHDGLSGNRAFARYKNSTWELLRSSFNWSTYCIPWAIDEDTCVYIGDDPYGSQPGYFTSTTQNYPSGLDLPSEGFCGITQLGDGTLFLLSNSGNVYSAPSHTGPFTLDNPSTNLGDFGIYGVLGSRTGSVLACSADGLTIVAQYRGGEHYWIRRGYDDWIDVGPTGNVSYPGIPAAINDQILLSGSNSEQLTGGAYLSTNGGDTWMEINIPGSCCAFLGEISNGQTMLALLHDTYYSGTCLWLRGNAPYSPWASWSTYRTSPETVFTNDKRTSIQAFADERVVIGLDRVFSFEANAVHYDPDTDSWTAIQIGNFYRSAIFGGSLGCKLWVYGTAYEAGKLHGVLGFDSSLYYMRWNGTNYDASVITGSSVTSDRLNIQADNSGQHIWITGPNNQLFHSSDSGLSWTNRYTAASSIHASPDEAVDVIVVFYNEVYVSFTAVGGGTTYFSKWNGSSWSQAFPDFPGDAGERSIFKDPNDDFWFFESKEPSGTSTVQKLISNVWTEQASFSGSRTITGINAFNNGVIASSLSTLNESYPSGDGQIASYHPNDNIGWVQRLTNPQYMPPAIGLSIWGTPLDTTPPWLENTFPTSTSNVNTFVSFDVIDDFGVVKSSIDAYVDDDLAFSENTFLTPYDGPYSSITTTISIDGYDGYHIILDNTLEYDYGNHDVRVLALDTENNQLDDIFSFEIQSFVITNLECNLYEITLDVTFNTPPVQDINLLSSANYKFDNGMYARKVEVISDTQVRLWVEKFYGNDLFTLTADSSIKNADGYSLNVDSYDVSPFNVDSVFTNNNGMVRTWHDSGIITSDTERVYLAGTKGIDVYSRYNNTHFFRWAQIFDIYGIDSMHVANYPEALEISDNSAPTVEDQVPPPSSYASPDTRISFKIRDSISAVEITSMFVYVNNDLVFSGGYGGWGEGWSGNIEIEYKQLSVEMWYEDSFNVGDLIEIRVVAQDLVGNELSSTYNFNILESFDGFGWNLFGLDSFGDV